MTTRLVVVTLSVLASSAAATSVSQYAQARAGRGAREWRGRGVLTNTLTGNHIADLSLLERCSRLPDSGGFVSERVLVYRDGNGTRLAKYSGRKVPALRYVHKISLELADGGLLLKALDGDGRPVASAHGLGRGPMRAGLRRGFELFVRPLPRDAASPAPLPRKPTLPGTARSNARTAVPGGGGPTREEYTILEPGCPGGSCSLHYRRTGRCPSWYGAGLCTLEVNARTEPPLVRWWRRRVRGRDECSWDEEVQAALSE